MSIETYSRHQVSKHSKEEERIWIIIENQVYDLTKYYQSHPGGSSILLEYGGMDGTEKWLEAGHSPKAKEIMKKYLIGKIEETEKVDFYNPMHKGFFAENFTYILSIILMIMIYFYNQVKVEENMIPFIIGIFPTLFLIVTGIKLWIGQLFKFHRIGGLLFLIQYGLSWYYYYSNYEWYKESFLVYTLLLNGCFQASSAIIEIGHTLENTDQGEYFSNKNVTISKDFITENLYYQILTTFSSLYYFPKFYSFFKTNLLGQILEIIMVFFPFFMIRPFFPKTLLRNAIGNGDKISTQDHQFFYILSNWAIKFCVLFGKHYVGYFINTVRFIGGFQEIEIEKLLQFMMLANTGTVSISTFLHTLKFKNKLSPRASMCIYLMILYTPAIAIYQLIPYSFEYHKLLIIFTFSLFINFMNYSIQLFYTLLYSFIIISYYYNIFPQFSFLIK